MKLEEHLIPRCEWLIRNAEDNDAQVLDTLLQTRRTCPRLYQYTADDCTRYTVVGF